MFEINFDTLASLSSVYISFAGFVFVAGYIIRFLRLKA